jgi:hypothetical protein
MAYLASRQSKLRENYAAAAGFTDNLKVVLLRSRRALIAHCHRTEAARREVDWSEYRPSGSQQLLSPNPSNSLLRLPKLVRH